MHAMIAPSMGFMRNFAIERMAAIMDERVEIRVNSMGKRGRVLFMIHPGSHATVFKDAIGLARQSIISGDSGTHVQTFADEVRTLDRPNQRLPLATGVKIL